MQLVSADQLAHARRALLGMPHEKRLLLSAAAPFKTGGRAGAGTDIPAGPVALRKVADPYVYPNTVAAVAISGAHNGDGMALHELKP